MTRARAAPAAPLRIRRARPADAAAQAAIMRAAVLAEARRYPAEVIAAWASLPALYHRWAMTAGREVRFVAERDGRPVGFAGLRGSEVTTLFVRASEARRGVGSALLARVEAEARRRGVVRLRLLAARGAVAFYDARGFSRGAPARAPLPGGRDLPATWMSKGAAAGARAGPRSTPPRPRTAAAPRRRRAQGASRDPRPSRDDRG